MCVLECAGDGGAEGYDALAGGFSCLDGCDGIGGNFEILLVHFVSPDICDTDRQKRPEPDVQCGIDDYDAFLL